jgi:diguanylate cyclase (GGDEF)-like protein
MLDSLPIINPARLGHKLAHALQGALLGVFAPVGWIIVETVAGKSPFEVVAGNPGLMAYMLLGTMAAFGFFGWLLGRDEERLARLAMLDEMTGLANNRLFDQRLDECVKASRRSGRPLSLLLVDLDRFKAINDAHGHQAGDTALKAAASVIRASIRSVDVAARVGGEEFAVILPDTGPAEAARVAERVLAGMRNAVVLLGGGERVGLTASIGLAGKTAEAEDSSFTFFADADRALYKAKSAGRDRLVTA